MKNNRFVLIALALVVSVLFFEHYFIGPRSEALRESIETRYNALRRDEQSIIGAGATEEGMKSIMNDMKNIEKRLVAEKTEFLSSARLQGEIGDAAKRAGLNVLTIRSLSPVKTGNYSSMSVYFEGNGNIRQISDFLKSIDSSQLLIKVDKLSFNITNVQNPKDLKFKIQVSALAKI